MKYVYLLFFCLVLFSCGSDESEIEKVLTRLEITSSEGAKIDVFTKETTTLTVAGFDQDNESFPITGEVNWSSNNLPVNINDGVVTVTALEVGTTIITAETENVEGTITLISWDSSAPRTEIYVSDAGNPVGSPPYQILKYDENGENPEVFISQNLNWPQDILFLEDEGQVLISDLNSGNIRRFDINTGAFTGNFATGISGPTRIKIGPDNLLYVLQWTGTNPVLRYNLDGTFVDDFTSIGVNQSIGLDWDAGGNLYVSSFNNGTGGTVRKFDTNGNDLGLIISSGLQGPTDIWFTSNGDLWINDWQNGSINRYDSEGTFLERVASGLSQNEGIDFLKNGNFLVGNGGTGAVKMFSPNGTFLEDLVASGLGGLGSPNAVRVRNVNQD